MTAFQQTSLLLWIIYPPRQLTPKSSRSRQPKTPSSPVSTDLHSLVGQLTSSSPSSNPTSVARMSSVFLMAASCGLPPFSGSMAFAGRPPQYSSGFKQDESPGPFLYLVDWNGCRDRQLLSGVPGIPPCPGCCPPSLLRMALQAVEQTAPRFCGPLHGPRF